MSNSSEWDAEKMLKLYLLDYLVKRNMCQTAAMFAEEADIDLSLPVIGSPAGFLYEWWTVFFDVYFSHQTSLEEATVQARNMMTESQSEAHDNQSQPSNFEIAKCSGQLDDSSLAPGMFKLEGIPHVNSSSLQLPFSGFHGLQDPSWSNFWKMDDPQQVLPTQDKRMSKFGSTTSELDFGVLKDAMFQLHRSTDAVFENPMGSTTLQGWPLFGTSEESLCMGQQLMHQSQIQFPFTNSEQDISTQSMDLKQDYGSSGPGNSFDSSTIMHLQNGFGNFD